MNILQINNCHYRRGGADVVYLNTLELLESNNNKVLCFSVKNELNMTNKYSSFFVNNIDFKENSFIEKLFIFPRFIYSFESKIKLNALLEKEKVNIAHIHLYKGGLTPSILSILRKHKIPVVITLHDYGFIDPHNLLLDGHLNIFEETINGSAFHCFLKKANNNSYLLSLASTLEYMFHAKFFPFDKFFDCIIAVSKFSKNKHLESRKFNWKIDHLYNFSPLFNDKFIKRNTSKKYLLFFGRLSKEKGIMTLLSSIKKIDVDINIKIVGGGVLEKDLQKYIGKYSLHNVDLLGYKKGKELLEIISNARFVVVPSEWYENNPMTIIESYCYGVPAIGSRVGGIPEIIIENKTGFTFQMKDSLDLSRKITKAFSMSETEYAKMSNNCFQFAKDNFSPENHYNSLMDLYKKTIKGYGEK